MNLIICALLPVQLFLISPLWIYLANADEMNAGIGDVARLTLIPALVVFLVLLVITRLLSGKPGEAVRWLIVSVSLLVWVQSSLIVWDYGVLDGRNIDWQVYPWRGWIDLAIWVVGLGVLFWLGRNRIRQLASFAALLVVIQASVLAVQFVERRNEFAQSNEFASEHALQNLYRFSAEKNVLHLIIDGFQSDVLDFLVDLEVVGPAYREALQGFTFYRETLGVFPYTRFSAPAFLSGQVYQNDQPKDLFISQVFGGKNILNQAVSRGYELDIGSGAAYWVKQYSNAKTANIYGLDHKKSIDPAQAQTARLVDLALFRSVPHFLKPVVYNDQAWLLSAAFSPSDGSQHWYFKHTQFLNEIVLNIKTDRNEPVYKYFHIMNTHNPMVVDEQCEYLGETVKMTRVRLTAQTNCTLKTVRRLFARMRQVGIYDNTLIIIHGDHGGWVPNMRSGPPSRFKDGTPLHKSQQSLASPLLAIKPPGNTDPFRISNKLVSLVQLPDTIRDTLGWPGSYNHKPVTEIGENETPARIFNSYRWQRDAWETDYTGPIYQFEVNGSHYETEWEHVGTINPPE